MCNSVQGIIPEVSRQTIAADITRVHCEITGAPPTFVHVFFFEDAPQQSLNGRSVFLFGNIREGRSPEQKRHLVERMKQVFHIHAQIPLADITADTTDVPASWVMEGGEILPEPGKEGEWTRKHDPAAS
jgi:phenylpyruvate tautomerase PptA (4-oxalocrotonate tautomerase family)